MFDQRRQQSSRVNIQGCQVEAYLGTETAPAEFNCLADSRTEDFLRSQGIV